MVARLSITYGWCLLILAIAQIPPLIAALGDDLIHVQAFVASILLCITIAGLLLIAFRGLDGGGALQTPFFLPLVIFAGGSMAGALPFLLSRALMPGGAWFESLSALTTTAATLLPPAQESASSLLLWQAVLAWIGAVATVLLVLAFLRPMRIGGLGLITNTFPGGAGRDFFSILRTMFAKIAVIYLSLGVLAIVLMLIAGLSPYNAVRSGLAFLATADYGPISGEPLSPGARLAAMACMVAGSVNVAFYWPLLSGRPSGIGSDQEIRTFVILLLIFALGVILIDLQGPQDLTAAIWRSIFVTISLASTTGVDLNGALEDQGVALGLMAAIICLVGGCAASGTGGIKVIRLYLLFTQAERELDRLAFPRRALAKRYSGQTMQAVDLNGFWLALMAFLLAFSIGALVMAIDGSRPIAAMALSVAGLANIASLVDFIDPNFLGYGGLSNLQRTVFAILSVVGRADAAFLSALVLRNFWRF